MRPEQKVEVFPDGVIDVYPMENRRLGPKKATLHFEQQSVGVRRFYEAGAVNGNQIDRVIKVPHTRFVNRLDVVVVRSENDRQYRINRIQEKPERGVDLLELQSVQVTIGKEGDS